MQSYIYRFDVAAIFIISAVMIGFFRTKTINTKSTKAFTALAWQELCACIFNIYSIYLLENISPSNIWLNNIINILYYIFFNALPLCFFICLYYLSEKNKTMPRPLYWSFFGAYIFMSLITCTSPWTHLVFYFDENLIFRHNIFFYFYYVLAAVYMIAAFVHFFSHKKLYSKDQIILLVFYAIACITAIIVQAIFQSLLIIGFVFSLAILFLFLTLDNPKDYVDPEMPVFNQAAFILRAKESFEKHKRMDFIGVSCESLVYINKSIGEKNKKLLYKTIADKFKTIVGKNNVYRITYDKFVLSLSTETEEKREQQIKEVISLFREPLRFGHIEISIPVNIRTVRCPRDASNIEDLLDLIVDVLDEKVNYERGDSIKADPSILERRRREHKICQILEKAISTNDFEVVYQPIYSVNAGRFTTAEVLVRLKSKEIGYIDPEVFIPLAEKNGMILKIGTFVFTEVCRFISENRLWEKGIDFVHVNLSVVQCMQEKLYEQLFDIMDSFKLNHKYINLEVTETAAIASSEVLLKNMEVMNESDMHFSLDDYGNGFSNINTLIKYPFSHIKFDKSMIWEATENNKARIILRKTIAMVKDLGMDVVAEGVENLAHQDVVLDIGCDYIQGHFYTYELSEEAFLKFLSR